MSRILFSILIHPFFACFGFCSFFCFLYTWPIIFYFLRFTISKRKKKNFCFFLSFHSLYHAIGALKKLHYSLYSHSITPLWHTFHFYVYTIFQFQNFFYFYRCWYLFKVSLADVQQTAVVAYLTFSLFLVSFISSCIQWRVTLVF